LVKIPTAANDTVADGVASNPSSPKHGSAEHAHILCGGCEANEVRVLRLAELTLRVVGPADEAARNLRLARSRMRLHARSAAYVRARTLIARLKKLAGLK
jgi:hypothetical protein